MGASYDPITLFMSFISSLSIILVLYAKFKKDVYNQVQKEIFIAKENIMNNLSNNVELLNKNLEELKNSMKSLKEINDIFISNIHNREEELKDMISKLQDRLTILEHEVVKITSKLNFILEKKAK